MKFSDFSNEKYRLNSFSVRIKYQPTVPNFLDSSLNNFVGVKRKVTLPFTAPSDGIIENYIDPINSDPSYKYLNCDDEIGSKLYTSTTGGGQLTGSIFIKKGTTISLYLENNITENSYVAFTPFGN